MVTLLSSLMDRSIPPVTRQAPSSVSSAPTVSRGALTAVPPTLAREYAPPTGTPSVASSVALRTRNWPPIRARPMSTRPCTSGRRPDLSSIRKTLPSITASPRSRARPVRGDSKCAPARSSEPPIRAPIRRTSPRAVNSWRSRTFPPVRMLSAWMERSAPPSMTVSAHSSRPPISDSQSQTADRFDVLALVRNAPAIRVPDRSRSRRIRTPFARSPGKRAHSITPISNNCAPSILNAESNSQSSNRSGKRTSNPDRSSEPTICARRSRRPWRCICPPNSSQNRRSSAASTGRRELPSAHSRIRPAPHAVTTSASLTSAICHSPSEHGRPRLMGTY
jgi:hypothetical protein